MMFIGIDISNGKI